jgi:anti-sigma factor RsiW
MNDHLSAPILSALADGELSADQLATANHHLSQCSSCTHDALYHSLLKSATAKAGQRYKPTPNLQARVALQIRQELSLQNSLDVDNERPIVRGSSYYGWAAAAALLLLSVGIALVQYGWSRSATASAQYAALATEACDQHIATLAANSPPEVISSDRHTVKPWFQGKLPFSFNLPENLPSGTTLDGANLTYIHGRPTAQLLYSVGKHRASVYLQKRSDDRIANGLATDHSGFHVLDFRSRDIDGIAVSDVDSPRLSDLVIMIAHAQE